MDMLLRSHKSLRRYDSGKTIGIKTLRRWLESASASSTSCHRMGYSVVRVPKDKRECFYSLSGNQTWVRDSPEFLVICADHTRFPDEVPKGATDLSISSIIDAGIYGQSLLLAAEADGAGGVFIGGIRNNLSDCAKALELPSKGVLPLFGICLGYPDPNLPTEKVKPRLGVPIFLHDGKWERTSPEALEAFDEKCKLFENDQRMDREAKGWQEKIAARKGEQRINNLTICKEMGFFEF